MKPPQLDTTDWDILRELQTDARLSYAEIGRRVGLSSPAVQERVRRMEDAGVIKGYHADIAPEKVGLNITALSRIRQVNGKDRPAVVALIENTPEIIECLDITGEDGFIFKIVATSHAHLDSILVKFVPYGQTITGIQMKIYVENRPIEQHLLEYPQQDD